MFVHVQVSVQFKVFVERAFDAWYRLSDPGIQIRAYAFNVIRSTVPRMNVDEVFLSKSAIADSIMERLYEVMADYGYQVCGALVTNLTTDDTVKMAMNEIEASKRLKEAIPHRAEAGKLRVACGLPRGRDLLSNQDGQHHRKVQGCEKGRGDCRSNALVWHWRRKGTNPACRRHEGVLEDFG